MLSCLQDYIGLSFCGGVYEQPASGIYLNSLPGISIKSIDSIANPDQVTYINVWNDVQRAAGDQFRIDLLTEIKKCYRLDTGCDYDVIICDNIDVLAHAWKYLLGVWMMIFRLSSERLNQFTTVDRKRAQELQDFYQEKYQQALAQGVLLMDITGCEICCEGNPAIVTYLP